MKAPESNSPPAAPQAEPQPEVLPPCRFLRTQEMYFQGVGAIDDGYCSGSYWCHRTQEGSGPDQGVVGREECSRARTCYTG